MSQYVEKFEERNELVPWKRLFKVVVCLFFLFDKLFHGVLLKLRQEAYEWSQFFLSGHCVNLTFLLLFNIEVIAFVAPLEFLFNEFACV